MTSLLAEKSRSKTPSIYLDIGWSGVDIQTHSSSKPRYGVGDEVGMLSAWPDRQQPDWISRIVCGRPATRGDGGKLRLRSSLGGGGGTGIMGRFWMRSLLAFLLSSSWQFSVRRGFVVSSRLWAGCGDRRTSSSLDFDAIRLVSLSLSCFCVFARNLDARISLVFFPESQWNFFRLFLCHSNSLKSISCFYFQLVPFFSKRLVLDSCTAVDACSLLILVYRYWSGLDLFDELFIWCLWFLPPSHVWNLGNGICGMFFAIFGSLVFYG